MNPELLITLAILGVTLLLFLSERLTVDLVALLALVALGLSRVLTPEEAFSGLSDPAVITILAIFILARGLEETGVTARIGGFLLRAAGENEARLVVALMIAAAGLSLFMNNIAAASILLPAVSAAARKADLRLSRLLMPLAFGTLLGGTATLFATTNIVTSSVLRDHGYQGFGVTDFAPVGVPLIILGTLYMALWGRRLLPVRTSTERDDVMRKAQTDLLALYNLGERLFRIRVPAGSYLIGRPLAESTFREKYELNVVEVERNGRIVQLPTPDFVFQQGDIVLLEGRLDEFVQRDVEPYLEILPPRKYNEQDLESDSIVVIEAVLSPRSQLIGRTLRESHFRERFGMAVLAIWNGERAIRTNIQDVKLSFGDALLMQGSRDQLERLRLDPDLIVLSSEEPRPREFNRKSWFALGVFILSVLTAALRPAILGEVMLAGALLMVIANLLTMGQVYRAIEWKVVFLVAGMLPLGLAMTKTGATALFAGVLTGLTGPLGPPALLLGLLTLTVLLSQAMKGAAVSAVIAPIAILAAQRAGADPRAMCMGVALASSLAFVTPLGHPVNILVMAPGGYRFRDFLRVGLPLTALAFAEIMLVLPVFWPLTPR
jgi:di/tricarboxylate transporter